MRQLVNHPPALTVVLPIKSYGCPTEIATSSRVSREYCPSRLTCIFYQ
jgi:hypothetical protein